LVALLRDSYVELPWDFVESMLERYMDSFERAGGAAIPRKSFKAFFDLLTVQRKLKDSGRFEYIHRVKGNPGFLVSIPASLRYVQSALSRLPRLGDLQRILGRYVPELG
jgi:aminoglycoside/choline kinase family phosphotransferase